MAGGTPQWRIRAEVAAGKHQENLLVVGGSLQEEAGRNPVSYLEKATYDQEALVATEVRKELKLMMERTERFL